eukprot:TRINITY_DN2493_c0_g2_i5.p1 TRINITY_DN2493_c0_g2~~TRINITY_DN2493_c0_g2_i5.p1  ORF type:complete len:896 (-),score=252.40 TRINITY_DN2493_c0_g2_i5:142-2829(-)
MTGCQDVDAIWAEMQADCQPKARPKTRTTTTVHRDAPIRVEDSAPAEPSTTLPEQHVIQRHVNTMADKEAPVGDRITAVTAVFGAMKTALVQPEHTEMVFEACVKPLIKRVYDQSERVRITAVEALQECWKAPALALQTLPYIMPVLIDRLTHADQFKWDKSEEVRLALVGLLRMALQANATGVMAEHSQEVIYLLVGALKDPHPEVKLECLLMVPEITRTVAHYSVWKEEHKFITAAVQPVLAHRHAKVRLAGLEALDALVQLGGAAEYIQTVCGDQIKPQNWGDIYPETLPENRGKKAEEIKRVKHNFFAMMIQDGNNAVRVRFYQLLGNWLSVLEDKMDHEHQLAPYLLSGLSDKCAEVRKSTLDMIDKVGVRYEQDNELEFKERIEYGQDRAETRRWSKFYSQGAIPEPFTSRPRLGSRVFVKSHAYRMIPCCLRELKEPLFTDTVRIRSAVLVRNILILLEDNATKFCRNLLESWAHCCTEFADDPRLIRVLLQSAKFLGRFVELGSYLPMLEPDTQLYSKYPAACTALLAQILSGAEHPERWAGQIFDSFVRVQSGESSDHTTRKALGSLLATIVQTLWPGQDGAAAEQSAMVPAGAEATDGVGREEMALAACEMMAGNTETAKSIGVEFESVLHQLVEAHAPFLLQAVADRFNDGRYSYAFSGRHRAITKLVLGLAAGDEPGIGMLADSLEGGAGSSMVEVFEQVADCGRVLSTKPITSIGFGLSVSVLTELNEAGRCECAAMLALAMMDLEVHGKEGEEEVLGRMQLQCKLALEREHANREIRQRIAAVANRSRPGWATVWWPSLLVKNLCAGVQPALTRGGKKKIVIEELESHLEVVEEIVTAGAMALIEEEAVAKNQTARDDGNDSDDEGSLKGFERAGLDLKCS